MAPRGRAMVGNWLLASLREAAAIGLQRVFCLTHQEVFFEPLGLCAADRSRLPEKVWGECVCCNKFLNCDEVAMWIEGAILLETRIYFVLTMACFEGLGPSFAPFKRSNSLGAPNASTFPPPCCPRSCSRPQARRTPGTTTLILKPMLVVLPAMMWILSPWSLMK